jgi:hypothetical protein
MEDNEKCVILSKKEYNELRSKDSANLKVYVYFNYGWRGDTVYVNGTVEPSEKLYYQVRRISHEIIEKAHEVVEEYGDRKLAELDEALERAEGVIYAFENLPWWKRIFYKPNYFKQ